MDGSVVQTYLSDILHAVSQALLAPDIILLLAFIAYALFCIGSILAENFSERRHFKVAMPKFLAELMAAEEDEIPAVIERSGLLKRQKAALLTVYDYRILPGDALVALIRRLVNEEETRYDSISGRNNMAARVSPMLGLMGTLIPLGPGIQALGKADPTALSASLLVAFDTTVAGLVVAAVCLVIGKIRSNWYGNYMSALDSAMATMLQKIEDMRAEGKIVTKEPTNYAFMFESKNGKGKDAPVEDPFAAKADEPQAEDESSLPSGMPAPEGRPWETAAAEGAAAGAAAYPAANAEAHAAAGASVRMPEPAPSGMAPSSASAWAPGGAMPSVQLPVIHSEQTSNFDTLSQLAPVQGDSFGSATTDRIDLASADTGELRVAPPVEEVPMPKFLDSLAQAVPTVEAQSAQIAQAVPAVESQVAQIAQLVPEVQPASPANPVSPANSAQPAAGNAGWYQPRRSNAASPAQSSYYQDMPAWGNAGTNREGSQHPSTSWGDPASR